MKIKIFNLILSCLLVVCHLALAVSLKPKKYILDYNVLFGSVRGFTQIPQGGSPGTSSSERPTLKELGYHNALIHDVNVQVNWQGIGVYGGYDRINLHGDNNLAESLVTHGVTIPAGTAINSRIKFDTYRFGMLYQLHPSAQFILVPQLDLSLLRFSYHLNYSGVADRKFTEAAPRLGLIIHYNFTQRMSIIGGIHNTIPSLTNLQITNASATLGYKVWQKKAANLTLLGGVGYTRIDFKDKQTLPNHINFETGPLLNVGIKLIV